MKPSTNSSLDSLFVDNLKHAENLINVFRLGLHALMISDRKGALEMVCKIGLFELFVFLLLVHLSCDGLISHILLNVILFVHEFHEVGWVHIWL